MNGIIRGCALWLGVWSWAVLGCREQAPAVVPGVDTALYADNLRRGDPHRGYFPLARATQGLGEGGTLVALIHTGEGSIQCELDEVRAPYTVANFVGLARGLRPFLDPEAGEWRVEPYYTGSPWHRAESDRFVQAGTRADSDSAGYRLPDEIHPGKLFDGPGVLAMANRGEAQSASAEFFITTHALPAMNGKYTIFGQCDGRRRVVQLQSAVLAGERPTIESIEIVRRE